MDSSNQQNHIVIIGSGQASISLAREIRKLDQQTKLTIVCADQGGFYSKPMLSNAFAKKLVLDKIVIQDAQVVETKLSIDILSNTTVTQISPATKTLELISDQIKSSLTYSSLVLATGASPIKPAIPGLQHSLSINHKNDYLLFRQTLTALETKTSSPHIGIIGGGLVGCELANDLHLGGYQVTLIERETQLLPRVVSPVVSEKLVAAFSALGIHVKTSTALKSIEYKSIDKNNQYSLMTEQGEVPVDLVLCALGLTPNIALATAAGLKVKKGIVCDTQLQTSDASIFALGDCAEVSGLVLPYILPIMEGAKVLAAILTGSPSQVKYPCMPVAVKTTSYPLVACPPNVNLKVTQTDEVSESSAKTLYYKGSELVGFCLAGDAVSQRHALAQQCRSLLTV